jgi:hypothetical protein
LAGGDTFFQRGGFYAAGPWHGVQTTPSPVRALLWAAVIHLSSVADSMPPHRGRVFKQRPKHNKGWACFGRGCWSAVLHFYSVAGSMPPHRVRVFKQRPKHNKRLCLFRARLLVGGATFFQRGGFYAAAPWQGIQATPSPIRALSLASGEHLSSVADSMPPRRGAVFKQRP